MAAGLLAGWSFDKKNNNLILGGFVYLAIFSTFYINFPYDSSWAFVAVIEVLAGHGLYKMGFGNFLGEILSSSKLKKKTNKVIKASKEAESIYKNNRSARQDNESQHESNFHIGDFIIWVVSSLIILVVLIFIISWTMNLF